MATKISIDGVNRIMDILPGVTAIDVQKDLYSEWKVWTGTFHQGDVRAGYASAFDPIGGQALNAEQTIKAVPIFFLKNGWVLRCTTGETVAIRTNLFPDPGTGAANIYVTSNDSNMIVETTKGVLVTSEGVDISAQLEELKALVSALI